MFKLLKYALYDILKSRFAIIYTVFLALVAISIYQVSDDLSKVSLSLMNIMILFIPLIAAVFATTHFYNNLEFIELMLAQPDTPEGEKLDVMVTLIEAYEAKHFPMGLGML